MNSKKIIYDKILYFTMLLILMLTTQFCGSSKNASTSGQNNSTEPKLLVPGPSHDYLEAKFDREYLQEKLPHSVVY